MFDVLDMLEAFAHVATPPGSAAPLLRCCSEWRGRRDENVVVGLVDGAVEQRTPDLANASLVKRCFLTTEAASSAKSDHATHSANLIAAQGVHVIRGIIPKARLLVAEVFEPDGEAKPEAVSDALNWLIQERVQVIAFPLGSDVGQPDVAEQIDRAIRSNIWVFAAAGNEYPRPLAFPARHREVIAVGAADPHGRLLPNCCREPRLDLIAPGWGVPAPVSEASLRCADGSSVACVLAAGAAALALGQEERRDDHTDLMTILCTPKTARNQGDSYAAHH
jgi:cell wall-associated protease